MGKRVLSLFMAIVFCISLLPVSAFAEDSNIAEAITEVNEAKAAEENSTKETNVLSAEKNGSMTEPEPNSSVFGKTANLAAALEPVKYIDKNGNKATCEDYITLTGDPEGNKLDGTAGEAWYVLSGSFSAAADWVVEGNGIKVLITACTEHIWEYSASETQGMHKAVCKLCSKSYDEAHDFSLSGGAYDGMRHYLKCACGLAYEATEYHVFVYTPNSDTLTHSRACKVCGYGGTDGSEVHNFTKNKAMCAFCEFKRGASVEVGGTLKNCETLTEAIDIAAETSASSATDCIVTLYGGEESFTERPIKIEQGKFTFDLNGADLSFGAGKSLFVIGKDADVTLKKGKVNLSGDTAESNAYGILVEYGGGLTLEKFEITSSCINTEDDEHIQYPAVKILSGSKTFTANNVVFGGGFEAEYGASVTPFKSGSFVYSCTEATGYYPVIKVGEGLTIADIIADGYALAEYDDNTKLVPMYDYNEDGVRVDITEIWDSVTVVSHTEHTFDGGYCACGYRCEHEGGFDADEVCQICGAHAVASVGGEMFAELSVAFARANELYAQTGENVTVNIIYDIGAVYDTGYATGKITLDLNGHDLQSSEIFAGKEDEDGNVIAEGELTIIDSSESKSGEIKKAKLIGGKLTVKDINVYFIEINDGEANVSGGKPYNITVHGGKTNISGGEIYQVTAEGGETYISGGEIERIDVKNGKTNITDGKITRVFVNDGKTYISGSTAVESFQMTDGESYVSGGKFDSFSVFITKSDSKNPKAEITGGIFKLSAFTAKTKGRITICGGVFNNIDVVIETLETEVRTVGDLLADGYMFHSTADNSFISGDTDKISKSAEVKPHIHIYIEKTDTDGKPYGECECGYKAEAVIEKSDAKIYYDTFEKAAEAVSPGNTLKLCFDAECENDVTIEGKGEYNNRITLNLDGKTLYFEGEKKLSILDSYINITDSENGGGYVSYLYVNWVTTQLYGGKYGQLEADGDNIMRKLRGNGCGFKRTSNNEWVTDFTRVSKLTDVEVKPAPYTVKAVVTNTPEGTEVPDVIYAGQKLYFKLIFTIDSGEAQISESNPASCTIDYMDAEGRTTVVGTKCPVTGNGAFATKNLAENAPGGTYTAMFDNIEYLGCLQNIGVPFEVKICTHDSYTNGICDICGRTCKHTDVSEGGICGTCGMEFGFQLITKDSVISYFIGIKDALTAANLEENKGCTVKLFKNVTMTQAERYINLNGGEFTIDLNGYSVFTEPKTELTHITPYIMLTDVDLTLKTSVVRSTYMSFCPMIDIYDGTVFKCRHDEEGSYLQIDQINFPQTNATTGKASLGAGVYLSNLSKINESMTAGEVLEKGCVFRLYDGNTIIPRSDTSTMVWHAFVIKCPHKWDGNKCKYCDLVCNHENGYVNGICPDCGRACEHKSIDENACCLGCKQQMGVKIESPDSKITYIPLYDRAVGEAIDSAENGSKLTLLADNILSGIIDGKTLTLDFNGKKVTDGDLEVGKLTYGGQFGADVIDITSGAKLIITGHCNSGNGYISVYGANMLTTENFSGRLGKLSAYIHFAEKQPTIQLDSGSYEFVDLALTKGHVMKVGDFLKEGYAFKYNNGGYASYNHELLWMPELSDNNMLREVSVVKCTEHTDGNNDGKCDYCNGQLAASVVDKTGAVLQYYANLQAAIKAHNANSNETVMLLDDVNGSYTVDEGQLRMNLKGHTVQSLIVTDSGSLALQGIDGKIQNITFNGAEAKFVSATGLASATEPVLGQITITGGASWSSILPDSNSYEQYGNYYGYKVYKDDNTHKWYDRNTAEACAENGTVIKNVSVLQLPVSGEPELKLNNKTLSAENTVSVYKQLVFDFSAVVCDGFGGSGILFIQKDGASVLTKLTAAGEGYDYTCPSTTLEIGTYKVWAEVTKDDYTCTSKTYTLNVVEKLIPTGNPTFTNGNTINYGEKIGKILLGGSMKGADDEVVEGTFAWKDSDDKPLHTGDYEAEWTFTPTGDNAYMYAPTTGKATIKVNKAALSEGVDYEKPKAITDLVYKIDDDTPQALHAIGKVNANIGTMKYTLGNPENADTVWSDEPITSRNAGEFTVYYKVFGDENHLDSNYGTITCSIAKYELEYDIECFPKVYDGTKNGDRANIKSIRFFGAKDRNTEIALTKDTDYIIEDIKYESENVGANLGTEAVDAKATINLKNNAEINYIITGGKASGRITPAPIENIAKYSGYTYKLRYNDIYAKSVTATSFGAPNHTDYIIVSDGVGAGHSEIFSTMDFDGGVITFVPASDLGVDDIDKKYTVKVKVYTKNYNYCTGELSFTIEIADKDRPFLSVKPVKADYDGNAVPADKIDGTATIKGHSIEGTWSWKNGKSPTKVTESGNYTAVFTPRYSEYYHTAETEVSVTVLPRAVTSDIMEIALSRNSFTYNGGEQKPNITLKMNDTDLVENTDYTVTYPTDMTNAGTKEIKIEGIGNFGGEKTVSYQINKATVKVKPKDISKVYGDEPKYKLESESPLITEAELDKAANSATFTSDGAAKTAPVTAAGYVISAQLLGIYEPANLNLEVDGTGKLTVIPAPLTITVKNVSREYGAKDPELTVSYSRFANGEDESILNGNLVLKYDTGRINSQSAVGLYRGATSAEGLTSVNYDITYVNGDVEITKIAVNASAGKATRTYLTVILDREVTGLTNANFTVKDSANNNVAVTKAAASADNKSYVLSGSFEIGKEYTVTVILDGAAAKATHSMINGGMFTVTPVRTSGGGGTDISTPVTYTVKFETNGGSKLSNQTVTKNSAVKEPTAPTKEGFDFAGWYTDKELTAKYDFSAKVTESMTLYAAWTKKDNSVNQIILTIGEKAAQVFGQIKTNDVAPKIVNDRTMLPARFVAENLGADVSWNGEKELVTITGKNLKTGEDVTILIYIGSDIAYVNGKEIKLDSAAFVENDRTYTPVRFISEELGASVEWFETEQKVVITK